MIERLFDRWERRGVAVRARRAVKKRKRERDREIVRIAAEASIVEFMYDKAAADALIRKRLRQLQDRST